MNKLFKIISSFIIIGLPANFALASDFKVSLFSNDIQLDYQYYLGQIEAPQAWDIKNQSPEVVVAVIDSGVDIDHPDLYENIWQNPDEVKDGLDNDNNGYIDDLIGWDFVLNSSDPRPKFGGEYSRLGISHGTLVAGVIGAVGNNNMGIAGVSWKIKIMPLKVMDGQGQGSTSAVYQAIKYAISKKADIINLSMVGSVYDPLLAKVIKEAYEAGIVIVAAAGNESLSEDGDDISYNLAEHFQYPICHDGEAGENYILGVGAVDPFDKKSKFSNFGDKCLDVMAPGEGFWGLTYFSPVITDYDKYYGGYWSGTSLATPLVSGAAGLAKALNPSLKNSEIYELIKSTADEIDNHNLGYENLLGSGRLNIFRLLETINSELNVGGLWIGPESGQSPEVKHFDLNGREIFSFLAYDQNFKGGVSLASADIDNDGKKEIISGAGPGGGPHVRIFNSFGEVMGQFFAEKDSFRGGINLAAGNIDDNQAQEIIVVPAGQSEPWVRIFDVKGNLLNEFLAFDQFFIGGLNVSLGDFNNDAKDEIIITSASGNIQEIKIFSSNGSLLKKFNYEGNASVNGLKTSAVNLFSDNRDEVMVIPEESDNSVIKIFSVNGELLSVFQVPDQQGFKNAGLTAGDMDNDGQAEIIVSNYFNDLNQIKIIDFLGSLKNQFEINYFKSGISLGIK